jgi:hypothetical protein
MKESDPALERLRVVIGVALIVVCGSILWNKHLKPDLEKGKLNVWESRAEVSDKFQQWLRQSRAEERLLKRREELERERKAAEKAAEKAEPEAKPRD